MKRFVTRALIVVAAILGIVFAQAAPASATASNGLASNLVALWTAVLETPSAQNSFGTGGPKFACWDLDDSTVSPFGGGVKSCTVKPDTKIFVVGYSVECSTFDADCDGDRVHGDCDATTADELLQCARERDLDKAPTVTVDGKSVTVTEVETSPLNIVLPADNVFGEPAGTQGLFVAHGWVTLLDPLTPGNHRIVIGANSLSPEVTTKIKVKPAH
jgi:hypothetical protein